MLLLICFLPCLGVLFLLFIGNKTNVNLVRNFSLFTTLIIFNFSMFLTFSFDPFAFNFQFLCEIPWLALFNNHVVLAIDGLSLILLLLTTFLFPVCILLCWTINSEELVWNYCVMFLTLEFLLIAVFCCLDLLIFYVLFEAILIPMYFIIGLYGSRHRKIRASYLLFLYTLVSSIVMFICLLFIFLKTGSTNFFVLRTFEFDPTVERLCWFAFFLSFLYLKWKKSSCIL